MTETIALDLNTSGIVKNIGGLESLHKKLVEIDAAAQRAASALMNMAGSTVARSVNQLEASIKKLQTKGSGLDVSSLSKGLGLDQKELSAYLAKYNKDVDGYRKTQDRFLSARKAAAAISGFEKTQTKNQRMVMEGMRGGNAEGTATGATGPIGMSILGSQVQASVVGMVNLSIPASQIAGAAEAIPREVGTGKFAAGAGGSRRKKKKAATIRDLEIDVKDEEIARSVIKTKDYLRIVTTEAGKLGSTIATTFDSVEGELRKVTKTETGKNLLKNLADRRALAMEGYRTEKAGVGRGDLIGLGKLQINQAKALRGVLTDELKQALGAKGYDAASQRIGAQAGTMEAQGRANISRGVQASVDANFKRRQEEQEKKRKADVEAATRANDAARLRRDRDEARQKRIAAAQEKKRVDDVEQARRNILARRLLRQRAEARKPEIATPEHEQVAPKGAFSKALEAFTPSGMALNTVKIAGWAAGVTLLYKSFELAAHSMARVIEIGGQTARLEQIFRGVGGSAQDLTKDILGIAAANGRSTEEAMESGIAWARLGLNRQQINEAVRVSTMAANVANTDTATTTRYLSSIMQVYGVQVSELDSVLGILNNTSNKYNVTNADLFDGISRSASVAKQAGISFAELQGFIGATVGKTGQTGSQMGNAIKSIIVSLNQPELQSYLKNGLKVQTLNGEGGLRSMSAVLRDVFVAYQGLNNEERKNLTGKVAGKTQASRFVALMESYVAAQKLAIDAQLNLNSAERENAKIMATQRANLVGLSSAWDKFVVASGNRKLFGGMSADGLMSQLVRSGRNWLESSAKNVEGLTAGSGLPAHEEGIQILQDFKDAKMKRREAGENRMFAMKEFPEIAARWIKFAGANRMEAKNLWDEEKLHPGANAFVLQSQKEQEKRMQGSAYKEQADLYRAVGKGIQHGRPDENMANVDGLLPGEGGKNLKAMVASGNLLGAQKLLNTSADEADERSKKAKQEGLAIKTKQLDQLYAEQKLQTAIAEKEGQNSEAAQRVKEIQSNIAEVLNERKGIEDDIEEIGADQDARYQKTANLLAEQRNTVQEISDLYGQMPGDLASQKLETRIADLKAQEDALTTTIERLQQMRDVGDVPEKTQTAMAERRGIRSELAALQSPEREGMTQLFDDRALAFRRTHDEFESAGVGRNEAEKLLNKQRAAEEALRRMKGETNPDGTVKTAAQHTDNDLVRGSQLEIELMRTKQQIQERLIFLRGQEQQIIFDTNREVAKALMMSGPGEVLQRLASMQMGQNGMNAGKLFSMDPTLRRMFDDSRGGDAGRQNRAEQTALRGRGQTLKEQQDDQLRLGRDARWFSDGLSKHQEDTRKQLAKINPESGKVATMSELAINSQKAATQIGLFAGATEKATAMLVSFGKILSGLSDRLTPSGTGTAIGPRVSGGYSLGAGAGGALAG